MNREIYNWNPIFNKVMEIKDKYISTFLHDFYPTRALYGVIPLHYFANHMEAHCEEEDAYNNCLERWIDELNIEEYRNFLKPISINQTNTQILIKYDMIDAAKYSDLWTNPNSIYREARSIIIDLENEVIVSCPFRKFFNIDEVEENKIENLTKEIMDADCVEWSNKLDCSMQNAVWYNDKVILTGSQAMNPETSWRVTNGYSKLTENYIDMIRDHEDLTFSFENINTADKHVVNYRDDQQGLYLIGVRDNTNGYQYSYTECKSIAEEYDVPMTEIEDITLKEALKLAKKFKASEKEGWVLYIDGRLVKIKCEDYIQMHKLIGKYTSANYIVEAVFNDTLDEFLTQAPDIYRDEILRVASLAKDYVTGCNEKINLWYNIAPKTTRKDFMIWVDDNVEKEIRGYVRSKYLGKDYNVLQKGSGCKTAKEIGIINEELLG